MIKSGYHFSDTLVVSINDEKSTIGIRINLYDVIAAMRDAGYTIEDRQVEGGYCQAISDLNNRHWCVLREGHKGKHECGCGGKW